MAYLFKAGSAAHVLVLQLLDPAGIGVFVGISSGFL